MLALIVAHPSSVRDGLVALLEASPEINKIVQVEKLKSAWDIVEVICPNITLVYFASLTSEHAAFITKLNTGRISPILAIVNSEEDRQKTIAIGADIVVMEGLPSAKLATYITTLL